MNTKELKEENAVLVRMYADVLKWLCDKNLMGQYVEYVKDNLDYIILDKDELN